MPSAASTTPVPACPRCGYDQSGEIARWATPQQGDAAPATPPTPPTPTGRCTECGLEFLWADVLEPERRYLPGFFEHSRGLAAFFVSAWQTWAWTLMPWRFWSRVGMHHEVRARRAVFWVLALWLSVSWIFSLQQFVGVLHFRGWKWPNFAQISTLTRSSDWWIPAWPFIMHNEEAASWASGLNGDPGLLGWRSWQLVPPIIFDTPLGVWSAVLANLGFAVMLIALPHTRSASKLQVSHLLRGACFGFGWLGAAMIVLLVETFHIDFRLLSGGPMWGLVSYVDLLFADYQWAVLVWIAAWWWCAIKIGYRIERWKTVALAATVPVALAVLVFRVYVFAYFAR